MLYEPKPSRVKSVFASWMGRIGVGPVNTAFYQAYSSTSSSGQRVNADSALSLSTAWSCARILAETVSTLPMFLYEYDKQDNRKVALNHPLFEVLHRQPHYDFTTAEFYEGMMLALVLWGNFYARILRMGERIVALEPLRADQMQVKRNENNDRLYHYTDYRGRVVDYAEKDIFHVRGFGGAGDVGLSTISYARQSFGTAIAAEQLAASMFANGTRPTGVLTVDQVLTPEQRAQLKRAIVEPMAGSANGGGMFVLEANMKFQPITMNPEDSQFLETRQFHVEEICRWFRVPPFLVGHTDKSTSFGTGIEQQVIGFHTFSLNPYLNRIEAAIRRSLIAPAERSKIKAEFDTDVLMRSDIAARSTFYMNMVQNGIMTRNEARRRENMPSHPDANDLTVQSQNVPLGEQVPPQKVVPKPKPANAPQEGEDNAD